MGEYMGKFGFFFVGLCLTFQLEASVSNSEQFLELELSTSDYETLLSQLPRERSKGHALDPVMEMGKRSLQWLEYINAHRPAENKVSFSSPETQPAYPIDKPRMSNPSLILQEYAQLKATLPRWFTEIVFDGDAFTENPPVSDEEYRQYGIKVDFNYARASRWLLQEANLAQYAARKRDDVRGYYAMVLDPQFVSKIAQWGTLSSEDKKNFSTWLIGICRNANQGEPSCKTELEKGIKEKGNPVVFHTKYFPYGQKRWNSFFDLSVKRPDVEWSIHQPDLMILPFQHPLPQPAGVKDFLVMNIEEEWKWSAWQLKLHFTNSKNHPKIVFEPGATAFVNGLGGNTITMDANKPISEYDMRWTIRHEFGHVIGFPDCYVEFYDADQKVMVSYQLDITNLMCSRRGKLKQLHFDELRKMYLGN